MRYASKTWRIAFALCFFRIVANDPSPRGMDLMIPLFFWSWRKTSSTACFRNLNRSDRSYQRFLISSLVITSCLSRGYLVGFEAIVEWLPSGTCTVLSLRCSSLQAWNRTDFFRLLNSLFSLGNFAKHVLLFKTGILDFFLGGYILIKFWEEKCIPSSLDHVPWSLFRSVSNL